MSKRQVRISSKTVEATDVCSFELIDLDGRGLPPFSAGSHIDVYLGDGLTRQYSLCNDPNETHRYQIAVLKDPNSRGGSRAMHALEAGQILEVSEPKNHFALQNGVDHVMLLAGGIGITPILCMAERLSTAGASFEMHYCTRSTERTAFMERIRDSDFHRRVWFYHDEGPSQRRLEPVQLFSEADRGTHLYVCGPTGFMNAMLDTARAAGWEEGRLHREYFGAGSTHKNTAGSFDVQIASTGRIINIPANCSVVAALTSAGITIDTSCEQGVCGTCITRVIDGTPDHQDLFLTAEERARNDQFLPCCSRSKSARLVLDL